ncbi:hypothetical protein [Spirosoma telluris]|uniref:hypothetical protein n=1 Tax=Spirosoma telluris TaxID=2183553 RepID=UPI002FC3DC21
MNSHHSVLTSYIVCCLLTSVIFTSQLAQARIVRIEITSRQSPTFEGKVFGQAGAYEKLRGKAYGELDPTNPQNALITDIRLAPAMQGEWLRMRWIFTFLNPSI